MSEIDVTRQTAMPDDALNAVLCYVADNCAHFTTQELSKQWGDDWNDAPYEHNAGTPYKWDGRNDKPPYRLYRVYYEAWYETPEEKACGNSWLSVEAINSGFTAWLMPYQGREGSEERPPIFAGTTLRDFVTIILKGGGMVYLPHSLGGAS